MSAMKYKTMPIPPPPNTQALTSQTFNAPPTDGSLTVPEMFDWHLVHTPNHPLFIYPDEHGEEHVLMWPQAVRAMHRSARIVMDQVKPRRYETPVVAILAASDFITYFTVMAGIFRTGYAVFPISPRNSPAAVAYLLKKTSVSHLLVGPESAIQGLMTSSLALLENSGDSSPTISVIPAFNEIYRPDTEPFEPLSPGIFKLENPVVILHSSGSTAFPKPIVWTHYQLIQVGLTLYFGEIDFTGRRFSCHSMPMYHGMGMMQTAWTTMTGHVITAFEPRTPATFPDADSVMKSCMDSKSDIILCVPSFMEAWFRKGEYVEYLKTIFGVLYGGGPLNKTAGDELWRKGVGIFNLYGCSEIGIMSPILPSKSPEDWEYFQLSKNVIGEFIPDVNGNSELVILPSAFEVPCVFNTVLNGIDAYATSDLFSPHPTKPNYWKVYGRVDDQIMHSTGEKTNPGPLENILNQDPHVLSSVMFGRGRLYPGVIIDPKPEFKLDPRDEKALGKFRNLIWPTIERLNEYAPQHSRIFKEMILVRTPSKPFTYTAKNTVRRQAVIADYDDEINSLYIAVQETTQPHISPPSEWTQSSTLTFIRIIVMEVLKRVISDDEDLFENGCDSLQATWIRNTLLSALEKTSAADPRALPGSFVYQHPSIASLASYTLSITEGSKTLDADEASLVKIEAMHSMVRKYTSDFHQHVSSKESSGDETVLLTGTTGWLGSLILVELLQSNVKRVYAVNRKGSPSVQERQLQAFNERGLDSRLILSEKLVLTVADLTAENFALAGQTMQEMRDSVTHIIHNAYPVDFNKSLGSFESAVLGLRRLIDFALSSSLQKPPRFVFISSVSAINSQPGDEPVKEDFVDARSALGSGYSESKWVCESVLETASMKTILKPVVVRVGQLSGISTSGFWNTKEWVPALFKSSIQLGCLPLLENNISWIPIDIAARAIYDMRSANYKVLHLAHPNPVSWVSIFSAASNELGIPLVPYSEWLMRLSQSMKGLDTESSVLLMERNPALRILDFFTASGNYDNVRRGREAMGLRHLDLSLAKRSSPSLKTDNIPSLAREDVRSWISYWRSDGFLHV